MSDLIGILELFAWIIVVIALAAAVTYIVIRLVPSREGSSASPPTASGEKR